MVFVLFQLPKDSVNQRQGVCTVPVAKGQCKSEAVFVLFQLPEDSVNQRQCLYCFSCQRTV